MPVDEIYRGDSRDNRQAPGLLVAACTHHREARRGRKSPLPVPLGREESPCLRSPPDGSGPAEAGSGGTKFPLYTGLEHKEEAKLGRRRNQGDLQTLRGSKCLANFWDQISSWSPISSTLSVLSQLWLMRHGLVGEEDFEIQLHLQRGSRAIFGTPGFTLVVVPEQMQFFPANSGDEAPGAHLRQGRSHYDTPPAYAVHGGGPQFHLARHSR